MATNFLLAALAVGLNRTYLIPTDAGAAAALGARYPGHVLPDMPSLFEFFAPTSSQLLIWGKPDYKVWHWLSFMCDARVTHAYTVYAGHVPGALGEELWPGS